MLRMNKFSFNNPQNSYVSLYWFVFPVLCVYVTWTGGLNQLSDLMIFQLGFWLQQQRGGGGSGVSHGVLVMGVRGYIRG